MIMARRANPKARSAAPYLAIHLSEGERPLYNSDGNLIAIVKGGELVLLAMEPAEPLDRDEC